MRYLCTIKKIIIKKQDEINIVNVGNITADAGNHKGAG